MNDVAVAFTEALAALMAVALNDILSRHTPIEHSNAAGPMVCVYDGRDWPCPDRQAIGTLLPDPTNRLLP